MSDYKLISGRGGASPAPDSQCDWIRRNGTDGFLCCVLGRGHEGFHEDHTEDFYRRLAASRGEQYKVPETWWFPRKEWERNFGAAARACYSVGYK